MSLLSLKNNISVRKEVLNSGKNQIQVGQVNAFEPVHTEDGSLFQIRKKELTSNKVYKGKVITIQRVHET